MIIANDALALAETGRRCLGVRRFPGSGRRGSVAGADPRARRAARGGGGAGHRALRHAGAGAGRGRRLGHGDGARRPALPAAAPIPRSIAGWRLASCRVRWELVRWPWLPRRASWCWSRPMHSKALATIATAGVAVLAVAPAVVVALAFRRLALAVVDRLPGLGAGGQHGARPDGAAGAGCGRRRAGAVPGGLARAGPGSAAGAGRGCRPGRRPRPVLAPRRPGPPAAGRPAR